MYTLNIDEYIYYYFFWSESQRYRKVFLTYYYTPAPLALRLDKPFLHPAHVRFY